MRWDIKSTRDRLKRRLKQLYAVKTWQLLVVLLMSLIVGATFFRLNSLKMSELRHAVIVADEKGDDAAVEKSVKELGAYVTTHMNTEMGDGFYLNGTYERAKRAVVAAAGDMSGIDSTRYNQASVECQTERTRVAGGYVQCVRNKVAALGGQAVLDSELKLPRVETYRINFVSPLWSLDGAGISVAISALLILIIFLRLTGIIILRLLLKIRFRSIS